MSTNKILVIGGLHGNEPLGVSVVSYLKSFKNNKIDSLYANPKAIISSKRFIENDLNRVFPGTSGGTDEQKRAAEILEKCSNYDIVVDFHNTYSKNNNSCFVGIDANPRLLKVAKFLGLKRVLVADYDCINKFAPNCISIEISNSSKLNNPGIWLKKLNALYQQDLDEIYPNDLTFYKFEKRVTFDEKLKFDLKNWKNFKKLSKKDKNRLCLIPNLNYCPVFIDEPAYDYFSGILVETKFLVDNFTTSNFK
ncbi:MAG: succinylglutamate desuccinylase/aspartoacylase family protein [bacterium]